MDFSAYTSVIEFVFQVLVVAVPSWLFWRNRQDLRNLRAWKDAATSCGLHVVEMGPPLRARAGPVEVRIDASGSRDQNTHVTIVVPRPPDFHKVRIRPEATHPYQYQWVPEIEVGDAEFDRAFCIEGPARLVLALLDARTRYLLLYLNAESRPEISLGELRVMTSPRKLFDILPCLLKVGQRLAQPMDVLRRLAENANLDPEAGVRLQNLLLLVHEHPGNPVTGEALRAACSDVSPQVRLRAAKELGAEGRDILLEFAESEDDDAFSAGAVSILDRELPFERVRAILIHALRRHRRLTARACLEALGRSGATRAVDTLAKVMAREKGELAVAAAQALGSTGSPAAEPVLILALQHDKPDLRVAAANALGRVGSTAAVLPLKEAAESAVRDPELFRATRQAIAEIQSRLPGASPGQLSLAGAEAGQLSLAQADAGQLSLAQEAGQGSLTEVESNLPFAAEPEPGRLPTEPTRNRASG